MDILQLFCEIDDFCKLFEKVWSRKQLAGNKRSRNRRARLSQSEVMTILVMYHESGYKNLKSFYLREIACHCRSEFRSLVSYNRFVELQAGMHHAALFLFGNQTRRLHGHIVILTRRP